MGLHGLQVTFLGLLKLIFRHVLHDIEHPLEEVETHLGEHQLYFRVSIFSVQLVKEHLCLLNYDPPA